MKGLILTNAYYDAEAALYPARRIREELEALGAAADVRRNDFFPFAVEGGALRSPSLCSCCPRCTCRQRSECRWRLKALRIPKP